MITISAATDINWQNLIAIAYDDEPLQISEALLQQVERGRNQFLQLIDNGLPCYGVTTALGSLVDQQLTAEERKQMPANMLRARAAAIGSPLSKPIARATQVLRLVNFLSGCDGVSANLCRAIENHLNLGITPWIPSLGHGMASDAIANTHAFQPLIGEGFVFDPDDGHKKVDASIALDSAGIARCDLQEKEGLALISGVTASPAYALDAQLRQSDLLKLANLIASVSIEALAAPKDAVSPAILDVSHENGLKPVINAMQRYLANSQITPFKLQAPVSYRIIAQVHAAFAAALDNLRARIESCLLDFSNNPLMVADDSAAGGKLLSVGLFHNQHLVNQVEHLAIALAHLGCLSERRLHRMLDAGNTGLNAQLAARPGLDAGLVVSQKASIDIAARLRQLAHPVSLYSAESSGGQEDYMALAFPAISRLYEMESLVKMLLAYELLAGLVALAQRQQQAGAGVLAVQDYFRDIIAAYNQDRSPGPDVELILEAFESDSFKQLVNQL